MCCRRVAPFFSARSFRRLPGGSIPIGLPVVVGVVATIPVVTRGSFLNRVKDAAPQVDTILTQTVG